MNKHTPGPWVWLGEPGHSALNAAHARVLDWAGYEGMWFAAYDAETDAANAHLIAAAPDLLAALQDALKQSNNDNHYVRPWHFAAKRAMRSDASASGRRLYHRGQR